MRVGRAGLITVTIALGMLLLGAAVAWACTPQATLSAEPGQVAAGEQVTVTGEHFVADGFVRVHWDAADQPGRDLLFEAEGAGISEQVQVPVDASEGVHYFRAEGFDRDGQQVGAATAAISVADPAAEQNPDASEEQPKDDSDPEPQGSDGSDGGSGPQGSEDATTPEGSEGGDSAPEESGSPEGDEPAPGDPAGDGEDAVGETGEAERPAASDETDQPATETGQSDEPASSPQPTDPAPRAGEAASEPAASAEEPAAADNTDTGADEAAETEQAGGPLATAAERRGRLPAASRSDLDLAPAAPSARTSAADLWSGLEPGQDTAMADSRAGDTATDDQPVGVGQQLAIALGLLGTGLVVLTGGGVVAVRRQRIAKAQRPSA